MSYLDDIWGEVKRALHFLSPGGITGSQLDPYPEAYKRVETQLDLDTKVIWSYFNDGKLKTVKDAQEGSGYTLDEVEQALKQLKQFNLLDGVDVPMIDDFGVDYIETIYFRRDANGFGHEYYRYVNADKLTPNDKIVYVMVYYLGDDLEPEDIAESVCLDVNTIRRASQRLIALELLYE